MTRVGAIGLVVAAVLALLLARGGNVPAGDAHPASGRPVLILVRAVPAGGTIDPANVTVAHLSNLVPDGAIGRLDLVAFREAAVAIPHGLPLVASLLREPGRVPLVRPSERAVGVRVDEVSGLPGLLEPGVVVDVMIGGANVDAQRIDGATVLGRPTRISDGGGWAVALRLRARDAQTLSLAESAGRDVRLLPRGAG